MKKDIILAGVGGQGILSIAAAIGWAALGRNWALRQAEVHGMSQRGGAVQSHLRLADRTIHSDLIPFGEADLIVSVEPMEALRYLPYLSPDAWVITNTTPFDNIADYPPHAELLAQLHQLPRCISLDADALARQAGSVRAMNMVVLGAASEHLGFGFDELQAAIQHLFGAKGAKVVDTNLAALAAGRAAAMLPTP